ncbi:MAG: S41 family peptidase, partial [Elusimicrobia bacterium]|nr:S41 family peptidase [Elusimicrobiota bacterium]
GKKTQGYAGCRNKVLCTSNDHSVFLGGFVKNIKKLSLIMVMSLCIGLLFPYVNYAVDKTYQQLKVLVDVLEIISENYVEQIDTQKLVYGAARGMVKELDDFSQFMEPEVYTRVKSDTEGEFGGIGIRVDIRDGWLTVVTPLPKTPAFAAGLYPNDKIIKIEGKTTKDILIEEAVNLLRGVPGTKVNITIARDDEDKTKEWITKDITLTRALIVMENTKFKMLESNIGYLKIVDFTGHVVEDVEKDLKELKKQGMQALIIDLRFNPGGLLMASVDISKLFLDSNKMIVFTKGRSKQNYQEFRANSSAVYGNLPLVVLVNEASASASEIVAGAMQDNKRAVIIGDTTYGKASVQSIIPLVDKSALRLTIAKYYTPSGKSIQRDEDNHTGGIKPDIEIKVTRDTQIKLFKQDEELFLPDTPKVISEKAKKKDEKTGAKKEEERELIKDTILDRAVEILKARDILGNLKVAEQK